MRPPPGLPIYGPVPTIIITPPDDDDANPEPTSINHGYPFPPSSYEFYRRADDTFLERLLTDFGVTLPPETEFDHGDLENRVHLLLSESQMFFPNVPMEMAKFHSTEDAERPSLQEPFLASFRKDEMPAVLAARRREEGGGGGGSDDGGENSGRTLRFGCLYALLSLVRKFEFRGVNKMMLICKSEGSKPSSVIALRVIAVMKTLEKYGGVTVLLVLFRHESQPVTLPHWLAAAKMNPPGCEFVDCSLDEQTFFLMLLLSNAERMAADLMQSLSARKEQAEEGFVPSFLFPIEPLSPGVLRSLAIKLTPTEIESPLEGELFHDVSVCASDMVPGMMCHLRNLWDSLPDPVAFPSWQAVRRSWNPDTDIGGPYPGPGPDHDYGFEGFHRSRIIRGVDRPFHVKFVFRDVMNPGDNMSVRVRDKEKTFDMCVFDKYSENKEFFDMVEEEVEAQCQRINVNPEDERGKKYVRSLQWRSLYLVAVHLPQRDARLRLLLRRRPHEMGW